MKAETCLKLSILFFSFFLLFLQEAKAQTYGIEENITYTSSSETHCSDEFCYEIYFNYSLIQKETDFNGDGIPDVISNVTFYNSTLLEIFVNDTRETGAYKWASAICNISGTRDIGKYEYNPATNVWSYTGSLNYGKLVNYGMPSDWCNDTNGYGFVLFGAGSGDKLYRLNFTSEYKELKIFTGKGSEILRFGSDKVGYYNNKGFDKLDAVVNASYPKIKLYRWNREDYLEVELPTKETSTKKMDKDKLVQEYSNFGINLYPLWNITELGGFEFEVILKQKPLSNNITFNLNSTNLKFYYQPPLYEEYGLKEPNSTCNATDCGGSHRPEDVVGSYAVYSVSKKNNEYMTGKLFHIYRPLVTDSNNKTTWAEINISDNLLTITINQTWLDNATYPIRVDPSFGYATVGSGYRTYISAYIHGGNYTMPENGNANNITAYLKVDASNNYIKAALYKESDWSFINGTLEKYYLSAESAASWHTYSFSTPPSLNGGTNYDIVVWSKLDIWFYYDSADLTVGRGQSKTYGTWPNPATFTKESERWSIFSNYTVVPDTTPPTYSLNSTNSTIAGTAVSHNLYWQDNVGLSGYIFSFDNCIGTLVNDTWVSMTGTGNWSNVTKVINSTVGCTIRWKVYANDTSNNWNTSLEYSYTTTSAAQAFYKTASDYFSLSESELETLSGRRASSDSAAFGDSTANLKNLYRALADYLGLSESEVREIALKRFLNDYFGITEASIKKSGLYRTLSDYLGISESTIKERGVYKTLADYLGISESELELIMAKRLASDYVALQESESKQRSVFKTLLDYFGLSEASTRAKGVVAIISDFFSLFEKTSLGRECEIGYHTESQCLAANCYWCRDRCQSIGCGWVASPYPRIFYGIEIFPENLTIFKPFGEQLNQTIRYELTNVGNSYAEVQLIPDSDYLNQSELIGIGVNKTAVLLMNLSLPAELPKQDFLITVKAVVYQQEVKEAYVYVKIVEVPSWLVVFFDSVGNSDLVSAMKSNELNKATNIFVSGLTRQYFGIPFIVYVMTPTVAFLYYVTKKRETRVRGQKLGWKFSIAVIILVLLIAPVLPLP